MDAFLYDLMIGVVGLILGYIAGRMDLTVDLVKGTSTTTTVKTVHPIAPVLPIATTTSVTTPVT